MLIFLNYLNLEHEEETHINILPSLTYLKGSHTFLRRILGLESFMFYNNL